MIPKPFSCNGCPLHSGPYGKPQGFSKPDGDGSSGVMVVAEALGQHEEEAGTPLVGKAGFYLFNQLQRVDIKRETLTLFNVVACRPPNNKLAGEVYEKTCIDHCRPNLDAAIATARAIADVNKKTFVIVTLGRVAFKRIIGIDDKHPIMRGDYLNYPFWSEPYQAWVIAADHPAYLMRGLHHLVPVLQFAFKRALEIANEGMKRDEPKYLLDPSPSVFSKWVDDYLTYAAANPSYLSYDIETPFKQGEDEEDVAKEDDDDYTILRCSFSYIPGQAVSVPWRMEYLADLGRLFAASHPKVGWNSDNYDYPRVTAQLPVNGDQIDGMLAWHVLNSALPKGLGFVTPFYNQSTSMWKHLSSAEPAFYNAKDADMALQNWLGIKQNLIDNDLWDVFNNHIIRLNRVLSAMSAKGVKLDVAMRADAETKLAAILAEVQAKMEASVPTEARALKVFKKTPKEVIAVKDRIMDNILRSAGADGNVIPEFAEINRRISAETGMIEVDGHIKVKKCPACFAMGVKADHFKSIGKKRLAKGEVENPCHGSKALSVVAPTKLWAQPQEFKVSKLAMLRYQLQMKHKAIINVREAKITFDEKAITRLIKQYPSDKLYPLILEHREVQKLLGTYIGVTQPDGRIKGGMPTGRDGRIHTLFTHNPSTLRSASQRPNLQNLPRPQGKDDLASIIRNLVVAEDGHTFYARDYSGIEAVLVGYFAMAPNYVRLAKVDVHSFYTAYALHAQDPGRISANDLPDLSWDDARLHARLAEIKSAFKSDRNNLYKHLVHGANFMQGPKGAADTILRNTGKTVSPQLIGKVMGIYFEIFPEIRKWHSAVLAQADKDGFVRNPFNYVHRFNKVYEWEKIGTKWEKTPGPDASRVVAFGPQSTAAGIIKEAMLRLYENHYEEVGQYMRLLVHDEIFFECPTSLLTRVDELVKLEMERPIPQLKLPSSWGMGDNLVILTEAKDGNRWGEMH